MIDSNHPDDQSLRAFVAGELADGEAEQIIGHLGGCDACIERVDRLWSAIPVEVPPLVTPQPASSRRVEKKLIKQIQRTDLFGDLIRLATEGLGRAMVVLSQPLLAPPAAPQGDTTND